jgi:hypothetical protein
MSIRNIMAFLLDVVNFDCLKWLVKTSGITRCKETNNERDSDKYGELILPNNASMRAKSGTQSESLFSACSRSNATVLDTAKRYDMVCCSE